MEVHLSDRILLGVVGNCWPWFCFSVVLGPTSLGLSPVVTRWLLQLTPSNMHSRQEEEERAVPAIPVCF